MVLPIHCLVITCPSCGKVERRFNQSDALPPMACIKCGNDEVEVSSESPSVINTLRRLKRKISFNSD